MNKYIARWILALTLPLTGLPAITDAITDFKTGLTIAAGDKILQWQCDLDGDGKNEMLLCLKSDFSRDIQEHQSPAWVIYLPGTEPGTFDRLEGIENEAQTTSGALPDINPNVCFLGQITELGKPGIVTMRVINPRAGESVGKIYAYTMEGNHLKRTELAQYTIIDGPHPLFAKYLADDKRTRVLLTELSP